MCPVCISTLVYWGAGAGSLGGLVICALRAHRAAGGSDPIAMQTEKSS